MQGQCVGRVRAVGGETEMCRIGKALESIKNEKTLLQQQVKKVVIIAFTIAILLCALVFLIYGLVHNDRVQGLLS